VIMVMTIISWGIIIDYGDHKIITIELISISWLLIQLCGVIMAPWAGISPWPMHQTPGEFSIQNGP